MAIQINFTSKDGNTGNYVNFDPIIQNKTNVILKMNYWKDSATRHVKGAIPMNDAMAGNSDDRIVGLKCLYKFTYDLVSTKNIFDQGYDFLKTVAEIQALNPIDC